MSFYVQSTNHAITPCLTIYIKVHQRNTSISDNFIHKNRMVKLKKKIKNNN